MAIRTVVRYLNMPAMFVQQVNGSKIEQNQENRRSSTLRIRSGCGSMDKLALSSLHINGCILPRYYRFPVRCRSDPCRRTNTARFFSGESTMSSKLPWINGTLFQSRKLFQSARTCAASAGQPPRSATILLAGTSTPPLKTRIVSALPPRAS